MPVFGGVNVLSILLVIMFTFLVQFKMFFSGPFLANLWTFILKKLTIFIFNLPNSMFVDKI